MDEAVVEGRAKLFTHGRSQAVRLPKAFRLPGKEVRVRRSGNAVILEPLDVPFDFDAWERELAALGSGEFLSEGPPEDPPFALDDPPMFD